MIVGIALVLVGADKLTDGATGLARRFDVSEMVIGLTVVAFGTSLPEFVTSFMSALKGSSDISIGNVVGSNIFNVLAIVGCSALVTPIVISKSTIRKDIPFAILATLVLIIMAMDNVVNGGGENLLSRSDGLVMLGYFGVFMFYTFFMAQNKEHENGVETQIGVEMIPMPYWKIALYIIMGLVALVFGGNLFVDSATQIAFGLGISETVIGLTLVAAGTSLPELATSIVAARKGSSAIAIGNVVGSNIFNIFFVLGICATIHPLTIGDISYLDLGMILVSMLLLWCFSYSKRLIERWEGGVLFSLYLVYMSYLIYQT